MNLQRLLVFFVITGFVFACESEKRFPPKGYLPNTPKAEEGLAAAYFWIPQDNLKSPYWKDASYVEVELTNLSTKNLYSDGFLNMTGTLNGLESANQGNPMNMTLKAGYDDEYIYILAEWRDTTADASYMTWLWNGPKDDEKSDTTSGWTSQRNQDNLTLLFDVESSSYKDAWRWSLAYTAPFDKAQNMSLTPEDEWINQEENILNRNSNGANSRSGPAYEWNGEKQEIFLADGSKRLIDPAYYLVDDFTMLVPGNIESGSYVFNTKADCRYCHGPDGNGMPDGYTFGGALNNPFTNKYNREGLVEFIGSPGHEGRGAQYWGKIKNNETDVENLLTFMRGIAGTPGHILSIPQEMSDIRALTNISVGNIEATNSAYQVLFIRKLDTGKTEDVVFVPGNSYSFSIRLSDNDEVNYLGELNLTLTFKSNAL